MTSIAADTVGARVFDLFCTPVPLPEQPWEQPLLATATRVGSVEHAGDHLPVYRWGQGPTVVLTHGWGARAAHMGALARALAEAGFSAVAYDGPAHTRAALAGRARQQATMVDFARALAAVVELVGPVHALVGHSMGGASSALAVSGFAEHLDTTPEVPRSSAGDPGAARHVERLVLLSAPDRLADAMAAWAMRSGAGAGAVEPIALETLRRFGVPVEAFSVSAMAQRLPPRTLLIHDADDDQVPIGGAHRVDRALGGGRLVITSGLGHGRTLTDPGVVAHVLAHLRRP